MPESTGNTPQSSFSRKDPDPPTLLNRRVAPFLRRNTEARRSEGGFLILGNAIQTDVFNHQPYFVMAPKKTFTSRRELIEPTPGDKRYVRRKEDGTFGPTVDQGKSLSADSRTDAKKTVPKGQGDQGDTA